MGDVIYVDFRGDWVREEVYDPRIIILDEESGDTFHYYLEDEDVMIVSADSEFDQVYDALFED